MLDPRTRARPSNAAVLNPRTPCGYHGVQVAGGRGEQPDKGVGGLPRVSRLPLPNRAVARTRLRVAHLHRLRVVVRPHRVARRRQRRL